MRAVISAAYPLLIQPFVSTEQTRYYLNGFYVHPDPNRGLRIVATDGHRMGVFYDREGIWRGRRDSGMIVKLDKTALSLLKTPKGSRIQRWLIVDDTNDLTGVATIIEGDVQDHVVIGSFHNVLVDGTYPDYSRVIPRLKDRRIVPASYNPRYLADFAKVFEKTVGSIRVMSATEDGPALVLTSRTDFFGVLMPMRASEEHEKNCEFPDFWTYKPKRRKAGPPAQLEYKPETPVPANDGEVIAFTPGIEPPSTESEPAAA